MRVSDLLSMTDRVHASPKGSMHDHLLDELLKGVERPEAQGAHAVGADDRQTVDRGDGERAVAAAQPLTGNVEGLSSCATSCIY